MKKIFLSVILFCLLSIIFVPFLVKADIVPCTDNCSLTDVTTMIGNIYTFIVTTIATPLAILAISIGGILMLISAGNPTMMSLGKKVFWSAIIGLVLAYASYLIVKFALDAIGYTGTI